MIFGQFNVMRQKQFKFFHFESKDLCIRQTEFGVNTFVTASISIIDTFVSYVVIKKKYFLICFPRELSQTSAGMVM